jgi:regulator of sirC expression with transglutaminase-like and TPR domain
MLPGGRRVGDTCPSRPVETPTRKESRTALPGRATRGRGRTTRASEPLLALLGDESPIVRREVRRELARRGRGGDALLAFAKRSEDPQLRSAARALALRFDRARVARRMLRLALRPRISLESGLWLMSRFETPELDVRPYQLALDAFAAEVLKRLDRTRAPGKPSDVLLGYLAGDLGYTGDIEQYHHPDNVYLHSAITRRRGMPLTLTAIYLAVARRAGVRAAAIALPGHVMLRIYDGERGVLCDPFHAGKRVSERECLSYLAEHGLPFQPHWFDDASDAALWLRHLRNLERGYAKLALDADARELAPVISVLEQRLIGPQGT